LAAGIFEICFPSPLTGSFNTLGNMTLGGSVADGRIVHISVEHAGLLSQKILLLMACHFEKSWIHINDVTFHIGDHDGLGGMIKNSRKR